MGDAQEFRPVVAAPHIVAARLPIELATGGAWKQLENGPAGVVSAAFLPGIGFERWDINAVLRVPYQNPGADVALGGRLSLRIHELFDGLLPIRLGGEATYLAYHKGAHLAGGVSLGAGTIGSLGLWGGWDTAYERVFVNVTLQVDLAKLGDPVGALLELTPPEDRPHAGL